MKCRRALIFLIITALSANALMASPAVAKSKKRDVEVNFIYAFELGFGSYSIGGLDVQVYDLPVAYTFNDILGHENLRLELDTPLIYGRFRYRETAPDGTHVKVDQDMMSFIPGLELQWEPERNWYIKPFVNAGLAWQIYDSSTPSGLSVNDSFMFVYAIGIGSLYQMFWREFTFSLGNRISWAGNTNFHHNVEESYGLLDNGFEVKHPLGFTVKGFKPDMSTYFEWYYFIPNTSFDRAFKPALKVTNQYEIAMTLGSANPFKIWVIPNPRVGVGYRFGDLNAFTVNFGFPF
jgi:hypothetical protein